MFGLYSIINSFYLQFALAKLLIDIFTVLVIVFSIIGVISTIKFFRGKKKKKESREDKWLRTGKMD